jgi:hypothetical protein
MTLAALASSSEKAHALDVCDCLRSLIQFRRAGRKTKRVTNLRASSEK